MENEFVTHRLALRMKALGYKSENYLAFWNGSFLDFDIWDYVHYAVGQKRVDISGCTIAPTWQSAFAWFRDNYGYHSYIVEATKYTYRFHIEKFDEKNYTSNKYSDYQILQQMRLEKLCEIVETEKL